MTTQVAKATEIFELQEQVKVLQEEMKVLKEFVAKADKAVAAFYDLGSIYGNYRGSDNRIVPGVITGAWPIAGTVDVVVFDNQFSGGKHELTGIELGTERNEFQPYLKPEPELKPEPVEEESRELVAEQH